MFCFELYLCAIKINPAVSGYKRAPKIEEIIRTTRRTGNSTWLLQSAVDNPNCIIISKNMQQAKQLEKEYHLLLHYPYDSFFHIKTR